MFKDNNSKQIFFSKQNGKLIEVVPLTSPNGQIYENYDSKSLIKIPTENFSQILKIKFINNTLIILYKTQIIIYPNFNEINNKIAAQYNFNKEISCDIKVYQLSEKYFLIFSGKSVYTVLFLKKTLLIKCYRQNMISFKKLLSYEIKEEFTGDNIYIKCIVNYENIKDENKGIVIQNFVLPNLEGNLIINYDIISLQLNGNDEILYINGDFLFVRKDNKIFCNNLSHENKDNNEIEIKEVNDCSIDKILVVDKKYIFIFSNCNEIFFFMYEKKVIIFKKKFNFNKNKLILLKTKIFLEKEKTIRIFYINDKFKLSTLMISLDKISIEQEKEILSSYSFHNCSLDLQISKKVFDDIEVIYINDKHSLVDNIYFYNRIINSIKKLENNHYGVLLLDRKNVLEIYSNNFETNNKIAEINCSKTTYKIIDFIMIDQIFLYMLIYDKDDHLYKVIRISLLEDNKNKEKILFSNKAIYNTIEYIHKLSYIILFSNYGEIQIIKIDQIGNVDILNSFTFNFSSTEISELNNEFIGNKDDLNQLYEIDVKTTIMNSYKLKHISFIEIGKNDFFEFGLIILCTQYGIITLVVIKNRFTFIEKVFFCSQIKKNIDEWLKGNYNIINIKIQYNISTNKVSLID